MDDISPAACGSGKVRRTGGAVQLSRGMVRSAYAALLIMCTALSLSGQHRGPYGLDALLQLDRLPEVRVGVRCGQVGTHDRSGANADSGYYFYRFNGEYVLFDAVGAGCVYRMWATRPEQSTAFGTIKFYVDGETTARVQLPIDTLFSGTAAPFLTPLVGNKETSCQGYYSYVPIPYAHALRVTCTNPPSFYQFTYHTYDSSAGVVSFTGQESVSAAVSMWNNVGQDPKPAQGNATMVQSLHLVPQQSTVVFTRAQAGRIQRVRARLTPRTTAVLRGVRIVMWWDDASVPQVDAPIGEFFGQAVYGNSFCMNEYRGLLLGAGPSETYYHYYPMPYARSARIAVVNESSVSVTNLWLEITYRDETQHDPRWGYFHAIHRRAFPTTVGEDYQFADVRGRGHLAGVVHVMEDAGPVDLWYLEGDERFFIDDNLSAAVHGTGTEDYYTAGWYFPCGGFAQPLHGNPSHHGWTNPFLPETCYRLHVPDVVPFHIRGDFRIEVGGYNDKPANYSSTAFLYVIPTTGMICTDTLDVGNSTSENSHGYTFSGLLWTGTTGYLYQAADEYNWENPTYQPLIGDDGRHFSGFSQFRVAISSDNVGVILRRRLNCGINMQRGSVTVDGIFCGTWYTPEDRFEGIQDWIPKNRRWLDSEIQIPPALTQGKSSITVRIVNTSTQPWTEYFYWVYSVLPVSTYSVYSVPPQVALVSPLNNSTYTAPATLNLAATATDSDGSITRVEFWTGTTQLNADTASPYSYSWTGVAAGSYALRAIAYDNTNTTSTSAIVNITVNAPPNQPPTVTMTSPVTGSTYTAPATLNLAATATDPDGNIANVRFYRGTTLLNTDNASPYEYTWTNVSSGTYQLRAVAQDNQGATNTSTVVTVTVLSSSTPPVWYTLTTAVHPPNSGTVSPASGTYLAGSQIQVAATPNTNYTFSNWSGDATGTNPTITLTMDSTKTLTANFTYTPPVNSTPSVTIISPADGTTYSAPANITITATATDSDGGIAAVRFYYGTTQLWSDSTSPYEYTWAGVAAGTYVLTAQAEDNGGAVGTSAGVVITVSPGTQPPQPQPVLQPGEVRVVGSGEGYINTTVNPNMTIHFRRTTEGVVTVRIYDLRGRLVAESVKDGPAGMDDGITWRADGVPAGVYLVVVKGGGIERTHRTAVMR